MAIRARLPAFVQYSRLFYARSFSKDHVRDTVVGCFKNFFSFLLQLLVSLVDIFVCMFYLDYIFRILLVP